MKGGLRAILQLTKSMLIYGKRKFKGRKNFPAAPKEEWAYINFFQTYLKGKSSASRHEITHEWKAEQSRQRENVYRMLLCHL
jgi:hypothetical protein